MTFSPPARADYDVVQMRPHRAEHSSVAREYLVPWLLNAQPFDGFDLVHLHGDDWFYFRRSLPSVRTFHGSALREAQYATSWRRRVDKRIVFPLELLASRLATASYAVGPDEQAIYHARGLLQIGVDTAADPEARSSHPTVLFVGTWRGRKRGALLREVFEGEVRAAVPDAELWMVADECPAGGAVRWIRAPSDAELRRLLASAWVFCLPSSYEGFGIPYLEAMVHGTPVVATHNPGARAILDGGRYGVLADDRELGGVLIDLLSDEGRRRELGVAGRRRAEEFSWERCCARHEEAYAEAIDRWRAAHRRWR
jgi:glycosyltransferase involved in cell wall biosynthesis